MSLCQPPVLLRVKFMIQIIRMSFSNSGGRMHTSPQGTELLLLKYFVLIKKFSIRKKPTHSSLNKNGF